MLNNASDNNDEVIPNLKENTATIEKTITPTSLISKWTTYQTTDENEEQTSQAFRETHHDFVNSQETPPMRTFYAPSTTLSDDTLLPENTFPPENTGDNHNNDQITNITSNISETETIEVIETSEKIRTRAKRTAQESPTREGFKKSERPAKKRSNKLKTLLKKINPYTGSINMDMKNKIRNQRVPLLWTDNLDPLFRIQAILMEKRVGSVFNGEGENV